MQHLRKLHMNKIMYFEDIAFRRFVVKRSRTSRIPINAFYNMYVHLKTNKIFILLDFDFTSVQIRKYTHHKVYLLEVKLVEAT